MPDDVVGFLVRAAREFRRGGWVFTGFHWPVLAGRLAHELDGKPFTQVYEAGASVHAATAIPTSTTDYPAYADALGFAGTTADVLLAMARRFDRVVLDAGNIDVRGRVNSTAVGPSHAPRVRLPGGGGAADVAARARELVWLHGGSDLRRIQRQVEHVTAAPHPDAPVRLHTRWGVVALGAAPALAELADVPGADAFVRHLAALGVRTAAPATRPPTAPAERDAALRLLRAAADRGYQAAGRALAET